MSVSDSEVAQLIAATAQVRPDHRPFKPRKVAPLRPEDLAPLRDPQQFQALYRTSRPQTQALTQPYTVSQTVQPVAHVLDALYRRFNVDLTVAHKDYPLGLRNLGIRADTVTITRVDSPITFKFNSPTNDEIEAFRALNFSGQLITEIYVSNDPGTGIAQFVVTYARIPDPGIVPLTTVNA